MWPMWYRVSIHATQIKSYREKREDWDVINVKNHSKNRNGIKLTKQPTFHKQWKFTLVNLPHSWKKLKKPNINQLFLMFLHLLNFKICFFLMKKQSLLAHIHTFKINMYLWRKQRLPYLAVWNKKVNKIKFSLLWLIIWVH